MEPTGANLGLAGGPREGGSPAFTLETDLRITVIGFPAASMKASGSGDPSPREALVFFTRIVVFQISAGLGGAA